jgi:hypothetical protein
MVAGKMFGPDASGTRQFDGGDRLMAQRMNLPEWENTSEYVDPSAICLNGKPDQLSTDELAEIGEQPVTQQTRLQTVNDIVEEALDNVGFETVPTKQGVSAGEFPPVDAADSGSGKTPAETAGCREGLYNYQIGNKVADLLQVEGDPSGGGLRTPRRFPKSKQGTAARMQYLRWGLAYFTLFVNQHFNDPHGRPWAHVPFMNVCVRTCSGRASRKGPCLVSKRE